MVEWFDHNTDVINIRPVWLGREEVDDRGLVDPHGREWGIPVPPFVSITG